MSQLKLYGFILCPYVQRVRFALEALNIKYDYIEIDLNKDKHNEEAYLKINPLGYVPSIEFNNKIIYESLILLQFLEDQFGGNQQQDNVQKAQWRIWANYFDQNIISKTWEVYGLAKNKDQEGLKKVINNIAEELRFFTKHSQLSERIRANPKGFYDGNKLTYADFAIVPHFKQLEKMIHFVQNKELFDLIENDDLIKDFKTYISNVSSTDAFLRITSKIPLPPKGDNSLLDSLNFTAETFNYDQLFEAKLKQRFDS